MAKYLYAINRKLKRQGINPDPLEDIKLALFGISLDLTHPNPQDTKETQEEYLWRERELNAILVAYEKY